MCLVWSDGGTLVHSDQWHGYITQMYTFNVLYTTISITASMHYIMLHVTSAHNYLLEIKYDSFTLFDRRKYFKDVERDCMMVILLGTQVEG